MHGSNDIGERVSPPVDDFVEPRKAAHRPIGIRGLISRYAVPLIGLAMFAVFSLWHPDIFFTTANFKAMVNAQAIVLLLALAASVPVRAGDLDFSVSSVMTASGATLAAVSVAGGPLVLAVAAALGVGLCVGAINALFIVKIGVDPLVMTLGMLIALGGFAYAITGSAVLVNIPQSVITFSTHKLLGLPLATWYGWVLVVIVWYVYEKTPSGRYLLFTGGNRDAAQLSGVPVARIRTIALMVAALISSFTGIVLVGQFGALDPSVGPAYLLQPFAAVFLGATTVRVGRINAFGTMFALYLLIIGITGLQLLGARQWLNDVFNGVALVIAITVARAAGRRTT